MYAATNRRYFRTDLSIVAGVAVLVLVLVALNGASGRGGGPPIVAAVPTAQSFAAGRAIPDGFLGLSLEYQAIEAYAGTNPSKIDPVLVQLMRNIAPGQRQLLRIGGDSTDRTWWPVSGITRPPGVTYSLTSQWVSVARALTRALGAHLVLGINLEANDQTLAATEGQELLGGLGTSSVNALELGNEPELYGAFAWYRTASGRGVTGRPRGYSFTDFLHDFSAIASALPRYRLAGPSINGSAWLPNIPQFLAAEPEVGLVTIHHYPLQDCFVPSTSPRFPSIRHLLANRATRRLADDLAHVVAVAHGRGRPIRIDELNTVSCGAAPAISQSFAAALWAPDALFELARVGFDGVNIHTFPGAGYELFRLSQAGGRWHALVSPEYYGLLLFAQATPAGSRMLRVGSANSPVKMWATRGPDGRVRVVLINKEIGHARTVELRAPSSAGTATLERLQAPSPSSTTGVTLGGRSFGTATYTGALTAPQQTTLQKSGSDYVIQMPATSAALLTLPG